MNPCRTIGMTVATYTRLSSLRFTATWNGHQASRSFYVSLIRPCVAPSCHSPLCYDMFTRLTRGSTGGLGANRVAKHETKH